MRKALFLPFVILGTASVACSSSSGPATDAGAAVKDTGTADRVAPHDGGTKDAGKKDTGASDDGGFDAGPPPTPVGTTVEKGEMQILGVTDDGYLVYLSGTSVKAIAEAGTGTATTLVAAGDAGAANGVFATVIHNDVFVWSNLSASNFAGTLTVWSHSLAKPTIVTTSAVPFVAAASDDSSAIMFSSQTSADGTKTAIVGASMASLATVEPLVSGVDPGDQGTSCFPNLVFSGTGASLHAVVASCTPAATDGGAEGPNVVTAYPVPTWKGVPLAANATSFSVDDTGTSAAIQLVSGELEIVPLAGGAPVVLAGASAATGDAGAGDASAHDAGGAADAASLSLGGALYMSQKDSFVLFNTFAGGLVTSKVASADLTTLLATGATDFDAISASEGFGLVDTGFDGMSGLVTGLALTFTSTAGSSTAFVTGTNEVGLFGDAFTADSKYVVYLAKITPDDNENNVGTLTAVAVAAPTTPITVAMVSGSTDQTGSFGIGQYAGVASLSNALLVESTIANLNAESQGSSGSLSVTDFALTGSQIAFSDNFDGDNGAFGQTDIKVVDLSTTTAATTVMKSADPVFAVSPDKKYIIYTITFGGSTDGIYTVAVP